MGRQLPCPKPQVEQSHPASSNTGLSDPASLAQSCGDPFSSASAAAQTDHSKAFWFYLSYLILTLLVKWKCFYSPPDFTTSGLLGGKDLEWGEKMKDVEPWPSELHGAGRERKMSDWRSRKREREDWGLRECNPEGREGAEMRQGGRNNGDLGLSEGLGRTGNKMRNKCWGGNEGRGETAGEQRGTKGDRDRKK
ncbi:hypothetical protein Cadr_000012137 [Camelus dromedarius]|uniref:Uncharacterized protein n=1 Tax=Camelus dromedarius TaxID=9838 RepID=A0A5N4DT61_CAMDR|nr:hypothetical protein Cadr_000012137 [Camelus dromedarius]